MSKTQRMIQYFAIAFALFLIVGIISGITSGILAIGSIFHDEDDSSVLDKIKELEISTDVNFLKVDVGSSNIEIKVGDTFKAATSSKYIECRQDRNIIQIKERKHSLFHNNYKSKLIIYIPKNMILDGADINSGAGTVEIKELSTKVLNLDLGAGKVNINNLTVLDTIEIDGGAGEININNSSLNNSNINIGVGKFTLTAKLLGNTIIDHGIGAVDLNLIGNQDDYQIHIDKGLGSVTVAGESVKDNQVIGTGMNQIDIDGGVGSIRVDFKENER